MYCCRASNSLSGSLNSKIASDMPHDPIPNVKAPILAKMCLCGGPSGSYQDLRGCFRVQRGSFGCNPKPKTPNPEPLL